MAVYSWCLYVTTPLVSGQRSYALGGWYIGLGKDKPRRVGIYISYVPTAEGARESMRSMSQWSLAEGWRKEK